jgi:CTP synthase (UTP-ammonia lyase)
VPALIAGKNSSGAITLDNPRGITIGGDSFQAACFNPDQSSARVHDWNLTLEREILANTVMRVAYVGNYFSHQDSYDNWNEQIPDYVW